jgi:hypothetical protein
MQNFKKSKYHNPISKKRGAKHLRTIPISNRLYQAIGEYLKKNEISIESNSYLFPSQTSSLGHISRKTMEALNLISKKQIFLHCIRMPYGIRLQRTSFCRFIPGGN